MVRNALKLCKRFQRVEDWLEQYKTIKRRYKFLVLLGSSGCGKTMFARTLAAPQTKALELNFASVLEPDLCAFKDNSDLYDVIIFDEMKTHTILTQKKLFQCSNSVIELGCSTTNCHAYTVLTHRKKFVVATNTWHEEIEQLKKFRQCDVDWLEANSVVLHVTEPMWDEGEDPRSPPPADVQQTDDWDYLSPLPFLED